MAADRTPARSAGIESKPAQPVEVFAFRSVPEVALQVAPVDGSDGGGPDDGFVAHYDLAGSLQDATYFGGSGADHLLGLTALGGTNLMLAGQTSSADLPTLNAAQAGLKGSSDVFVAQISSTALFMSFCATII